ncbi:MAG: polyphosphate kinase 2 family protein [Deltaproteobacteria bacterium]|nr:polyphosphate kinase 2 family protein [Deltaproteobacteria bacterium]
MEPLLFDPPASRYLVPFDGSFDIGKADTDPPDDGPGKKDNQEALASAVARIAKVQAKLYADDRFSLLLIFQAMDAAGKDGTIRAVLSGVNPAGCEVTAFNAPSAEELDHDYLWRHQRALPQRGRIGVWNRSHYEEVLVVRLNPKFLGAQRLPRRPAGEGLWVERLASMRDAEAHWARNGVAVLKFFLNVSKKEQKKRLLERIDDPEVNWKFQAADIGLRNQWDDYMRCYQEAMNATSRPWAPWYAVPADSKSYMRRVVAEVVASSLERLDLRWPELSPEARAEMMKLRATLAAD